MFSVFPSEYLWKTLPQITYKMYLKYSVNVYGKPFHFLLVKGFHSLCVWKTLPLQEITGFHSQCIYRRPYHSFQDNKAENHGSYDGGSIIAPQLL